MLDLNDEITKFQKEVLTLKNDTMAIDEKFLGGGVTIRDLVQENGFIIKQMRKMKDVFLNYCQLNAKVYKKIISHELSAAAAENKIVATAKSIDRRLDDQMAAVQKIKEEAFTQVFKNKEETNVVIENFGKTMEGKVTEEGFQPRIKQLFIKFEEQEELDDIDQRQAGNIPFQNEIDNEEKETNTTNTVRPSNRKKKKGLTTSDIEQFKLQMMPLIDKIEDKINRHSHQFQLVSQNIQSVESKTFKINTDFKRVSEQIAFVRKEIRQVRSFSDKQHQKILHQLKEQTNDQVWKKRFRQFQYDKVSPKIQKIENVLAQKIKPIEQQIEMGKNLSEQMSQKIESSRERTDYLAGEMGQHKGEVLQNFIKYEKRHELILDKFEGISRKNQQMNQALQTKISQISKLFQIEVQDLSKRLDMIKEAISEDIFKKIQKKLGKDFREIRLEIFCLNSSVKNVQNKMKDHHQEVGHVKEVVASKANFTDVLQAFDKKVDKSDFNQLEQAIKTQTSQKEIKTTKRNKRSEEKPRKQRRSSWYRENTVFCSNHTRDEGKRILTNAKQRLTHSIDRGGYGQQKTKLRYKTQEITAPHTLLLIERS